MTGILEAAKAYQARGWYVIPIHFVGPDGLTCSCNKGRNCTSKGKHPVDFKWQEIDGRMVDIDHVWQRRPRSNVGLATGSASGFWVLDVDPDSGGADTMRAMLAALGKLERTYTVRTGSGGYHFYFLLPDDFVPTNGRGRIKEYGGGVDVRGDGGQVVAPPSMTDKGGYVVTADVPLIRSPKWLEDLIRPAEPETPMAEASAPAPGPIEPRLARYTDSAVKLLTDRLDAMRAVTTKDPRDYRGEAWNNTTFEVACSLIELANAGWNGFDLNAAYAALFDHAPRDNSFGDREILACYQSAAKKVGTNARPEPPAPKTDEVNLFLGKDVRDESSSAKKEAKPSLAPASSSVRKQNASGNGSNPQPAEDADFSVDDDAEWTSPESFFDKKDLLITKLRDGVMAAEPIGWGADKQFWTYAEGVWSPDPEVVARRCVMLLGDRYRNSHVDNVTKPVRFISKRLSADPHAEWMNFRNGMLDWASGEMTEHDPDLLSTIQFPIDWNPEATCPTFDAWLEQVLHPDYAALAWEMIGYLMLSGNPQQVAFMLYGDGGNGKGTLIRVIQALLGEHNCAAETLNRLNSDRFSPVNLFGRIANIAGDIDGTYQESTATFKALTGEDIFGGERKFGDRFTFTSYAVPLFSANKIPGSADVTEGYLRRWVVLKFDRKFLEDQKILGMSDRLAAEREGIAIKGVEALRRLTARGKFDIKGEALKGKQEFAETIDQVRQWITQKVILAPEHFESVDDLYADYAIWQAANNVGKLGKLEFGHRLSTIGLESSRHNDRDGFLGLRVEARGKSPSSAFFVGSEGLFSDAKA